MHLIGGAIVLAAGVGVFTGKVWARVVGVLLAYISAIINFCFIGAHPLWSIMMIVMCFVIILALTVHGSEVKAQGLTRAGRDEVFLCLRPPQRAAILYLGPQGWPQGDPATRGRGSPPAPLAVARRPPCRDAEAPPAAPDFRACTPLPSWASTPRAAAGSRPPPV